MRMVKGGKSGRILRMAFGNGFYLQSRRVEEKAKGLVGMTEEKPPWWSTGEGTLKLCVKCNQSFRDYTSKLKHTLCRSCWKISNDKSGFQNERLPEETKKKGRNYACRVCNGHGFAIDGDACDSCLGTGIGEIEGTSELELGR